MASDQYGNPIKKESNLNAPMPYNKKTYVPHYGKA